MILLSMEIPTNHIHELDPLIDFHFVIASEVKRNPAYGNAYVDYIQQPNRKKVLLDNGMYEEGRPLSPMDLFEICKLLEPDFVFAPDQFEDMKQTLELTREFLDLSKNQSWKVGVIPQGKDVEEVCLCYRKMLCFPFQGPIGLSFLNDRQAVCKEIERTGGFIYQKWYHMLGLYSLEDIKTWPKFIYSMDSVKPIKGAKYNYRMDLVPRGLGKWSPDWIIQNKPVLYYNIARLRRALRGEDYHGYLDQS